MTIKTLGGGLEAPIGQRAENILDGSTVHRRARCRIIRSKQLFKAMHHVEANKKDGWNTDQSQLQQGHYESYGRPSSSYKSPKS